MTSKTGSCDNALEIDKVVVGVGVTAGLSAAAVQRAAEIAGEIAFGSTGIAPPKAASSRTVRYSATARLEVGSRSSTVATPRRR